MTIWTYADLFQHLVHDDLNMLITDISTLLAIHLLHLSDHIILYRPHTLDRRVEELFEARKPKRTAILTEIAGVAP